MMDVLGMFSGLGAYELGAQRAGARIVGLCEKEPHLRALLRRHWPDTPVYEDARDITAKSLRQFGIAPNAIIAGWPCQGLSVAGEGLGLDDPRSGLWTEIVRVLGFLRPNHAILENSSNLLSGPPANPGKWFSDILSDLAEIGYDAEWHCLPSAAFDAPHIRDRVWIIATPADAKGQRRRSQRAKSTGQPRRSEPYGNSAVAYAYSLAPVGTAIARQERVSWAIEPDVVRVVHGSPARMERVHALGNCNPPVIPEQIVRAILEQIA